MTLDDAQVVALVGAQYGSEGKGVIAAAVAHDFDVHARTGGPNAGHTFMAKGEKFVARSLPCGWINPEATCVIGPGAVVDLPLLLEEIAEAEVRMPGVRDRVMLDEKAHVVTEAQHRFEGGVDGSGHRRIGSTGEGVGMARIARILRTSWMQSEHWAKAVMVDHLSAKQLDGVRVGDTSRLVNAMIDSGERVLLEGTQGSGLSLTHGPWPFCTSTDTNAAQLAADAGVAPQLVQTLLVARTFPIRVHGNSGPLPGEIEWRALGVEPEVTTVTKKRRRIARWDWGQMLKAVELNRPVGLALTFLDYWDPDCRGAQTREALPLSVVRNIDEIEKMLGVPVVYASTGPAGTPVIDMKARVVA